MGNARRIGNRGTGEQETKGTEVRSRNMAKQEECERTGGTWETGNGGNTFVERKERWT